MSHTALIISGAIVVTLTVIAIYILIIADVYVTYLITGYVPFSDYWMHIRKLYANFIVYWFGNAAYHEVVHV